MGVFFIHIVTWCLVWEIGHCGSVRGNSLELEGREKGGGEGGEGEGSAFTQEKFLEEELEARRSTQQNIIEIYKETLKRIGRADQLFPRLVDSPGAVEPDLGEDVLRSNKTDKFLSNPSQALCTPDIKAVDLGLTSTNAGTYYPTCVRLKQCGGCCLSKGIHSCQPIASEKVVVQVLQLVSQEESNQLGSREGGTRRRGRRRRLRVQPNRVNVTVEEHTECACMCQLREADCDLAVHTYNQDTCSCDCKKADDEAKCFLSDRHIWNKNLCQCLCRNVKECSTSDKFDHPTCDEEKAKCFLSDTQHWSQLDCQCLCNFVDECINGYKFDHHTCTCEPQEFYFNFGARSLLNTNPKPAQGCGVNTKKSLFGRIVGGTPAGPKDWPWMAAILKVSGDHPYCGGSLITYKHILTAAHCLINYKKEDFKVRLGEYSFDTPDENNPTDFFRVDDIKMHKRFNPKTYENDIAILKMGRPSSFSEFIWPVCLPPPNTNFENQLGYVIGWGTKHYTGPVSSVLQEVVIPVWNQSACVAAYPEEKVTDAMMCAGLRAGGKDSCNGDSGGPFLVQIFPHTRWYVAGIVSWGFMDCGSPNRPGVYTRVNRYLDWINGYLRHDHWRSIGLDLKKEATDN